MTTVTNELQELYAPLSNGRTPLKIGTLVYARDGDDGFQPAMVIQIFRPDTQVPKKRKYFHYELRSLKTNTMLPSRYHRKSRGIVSAFHCFTEEEYKKRYPSSALVASEESEKTVSVPPVQYTNYKHNRCIRKKFLFNTKKGDSCPWCPFKGDTMKRTLLEHMCGPRSCKIPIDQRANATVVNDSSFAKAGDHPHDMLRALGFRDPQNFIEEYTERKGGKCPHCNFRSIAARKVKRHIRQVHTPKDTPQDTPLAPTSLSVEPINEPEEAIEEVNDPNLLPVGEKVMLLNKKGMFYQSWVTNVKQSTNQTFYTVHDGVQRVGRKTHHNESLGSYLYTLKEFEEKCPSPLIKGTSVIAQKVNYIHKRKRSTGTATIIDYRYPNQYKIEWKNDGKRPKVWYHNYFKRSSESKYVSERRLLTIKKRTFISL